MQPVLREYTLVAEPVKWEIQPGLVVDGWGYNGSTPGPTIRVTEGDTVQVDAWPAGHFGPEDETGEDRPEGGK